MQDEKIRPRLYILSKATEKSIHPPIYTVRGYLQYVHT